MLYSIQAYAAGGVLLIMEFSQLLISRYEDNESNINI